MPFNVIGGRIQSPVKPEHIDATKHFFDAFDNSETEDSAGIIVRFCQNRRRGWEPFTQKDIESYYNWASGRAGFSFNRLLDRGWIVKRGDKYRVTLQFIARVWGSSPAV